MHENNDTGLSVPTMESSRRCDHCDAATALLYCRADSAKLCFACDRHVHSANALFSRHTRSLLCDFCGSSPASIFCSDESSLLCHDCDWEAHRSSLLHHHRRRPLEGFSACPDVSDFLAFLGFEDLDKKSLLEEDWDLEKGCDDFFMWDLVPCIDDALVGLVAPDSGRGFQAIGVPPPPKNRNAVCGRYKEEVLRQLRELARDEPESDNCRSVRKESLLGPEQVLDLNSFLCEAAEEEEANGVHQQFELGSSCQPFDDDTVHQSNAHSGEGLWDAEKHSDLGDCLSQMNNNEPAEDSKAPSQSFQKVPAYEISSQERESAISRYKEKRKSRSFDKRIRYESRKVRAESRTRIKGRFAKIEH